MDVLIVEDEDGLRESVVDGIEAAIEGLWVIAAESAEAADEKIQEHGWPQVVVSDIRLPGRSGIDFLMDLRRQRIPTKVILISAFASVAAFREEDTGGVLKFLPKPFELPELIESVRTALKHQEFSGSINGITFIDILQVLNMGKKTAAVRLRHDDHVGHIYMDDGEIVHADSGPLEGIEAFNSLVEWPHPAFKVLKESPPDHPRSIDASFGFLLLEATRLKDEARRQRGEQIEDDESEAPESLETPSLPEPDLPVMNLQVQSISEKSHGMKVEDLRAFCRELVTETPEAVASNVVDLDSGTMLAGHFDSAFSTDHFEAVSAAVTNLFRGKEILRVEKLVKSQRGDLETDHFMQQAHLSTTNLEHFVVKIPEREAVLTLVTRRPCNLGMGWSAVRSAAPKITDSLPS